MKLLNIIISIFLLTSCITKEENVVNVGLLNGPSSIVMAAAVEEQTYFEGERIHYQIKDNPQHLRALIQSGNLDMAIVPMTMAYNMIENNFRIKIVAITGWGNLFLLSHDSISSFQELEGQIISVPGEGQTPDLVSKFLIDYFAMQNKIGLNYTYPSPMLLTSALAIGKVKYGVLPEPLASLALQKAPSLKRSINIAELWQESLPDIPLVQSVLIIKTPFLTENKEWCNQYINAVQQRAISHINHPAQALQLAQKHEMLPASITDSMIVINSRLDFKSGTIIADDIAAYLKTFYALEEDFSVEKYLMTEH